MGYNTKVTPEIIDHIISDYEWSKKLKKETSVSKIAENSDVARNTAYMILNLYDYVKNEKYVELLRYIEKYNAPKTHLKYIVEKLGYNFEGYMKEARHKANQITTPSNPTIENSVTKPRISGLYIDDLMPIVYAEIIKSGLCGVDDFIADFNNSHTIDGASLYCAIRKLADKGQVYWIKTERGKEYLFANQTYKDDEILKVLHEISDKLDKVGNDDFMLTTSFYLTGITQMLRDVLRELIPNYDIKCKNREMLAKQDAENVANIFGNKATEIINSLKIEEEKKNA